LLIGLQANEYATLQKWLLQIAYSCGLQPAAPPDFNPKWLFFIAGNVFDQPFFAHKGRQVVTVNPRPLFSAVA